MGRSSRSKLEQPALRSALSGDLRPSVGRLPLFAELARPLLIEESEGRERLLTDPQEDPMANKNRKNELSIFIDVPFGLDLWTLFTLDLD